MSPNARHHEYILAHVTKTVEQVHNIDTKFCGCQIGAKYYHHGKTLGT